MKKILVLSFNIILVFSVWAFSFSRGEICLGEWNAGFSKGLSYANETCTPMLLLWARSSCPMCNQMKSALDSADFQEWLYDHRIIMSVCHDGDSDAKAGLKFIRSINPWINELPLFCIYWPKTDGTIIERAFVGRDGYMPVKLGPLALQLTSSVEKVLVDSGFAFSSTLDSPRPSAPMDQPMPAFALRNATVESVQHIPFEEYFQVTNTVGGMVQVKKASGRLPSGIKVSYDSVSKRVLFKGNPTKAGTFTSSWILAEKRDVGIEKGSQTFTLTITVVPVSKVCSAFTITKSVKTSGFILSEDGEMQGIISLTLSEKGQAKIQYDGVDNKLKAVSKGWKSLSSDGILEISGTGVGCSFLLAVTSEGQLIGNFISTDGVSRRICFSHTLWTAKSPASLYVMDRKIILENETELQLVMKKAAAKTGVVSIKGTFPNRLRINTKSVLVESTDCVTTWLPVFRKSGKNVVIGLLSLDLNSGKITGTIKIQGQGNVTVLASLP
ncbi:MAG: hypothetical protein MJ240_00075 [Kiritimatiellae bacterium]|nr:hypothetical protein [Kiritimatiellia bacterium]